MDNYHQERKQELVKVIRQWTDEFLDNPSDVGYHHLKNKLAEYYNHCQIEYDQTMNARMKKMREELGIKKP